jgi:hypothetical protein
MTKLEELKAALDAADAAAYAAVNACDAAWAAYDATCEAYQDELKKQGKDQ